MYASVRFTPRSCGLRSTPARRHYVSGFETAAVQLEPDLLALVVKADPAPHPLRLGEWIRAVQAIASAPAISK